MMALKAGRSALRLVPSYTCTLRHRVDSAPALLQRVASSFSTGARTNQEAVAHETSASPAGTSVHTPKVSTAPKSRPKAHTGRTTSKPRTKKADSTTTPKAAKPKAAAKQPKKTVRVKAKKPAKKVLTEEQKVAKKEEAQKQKARDHIRELKQTALTKPKALPQTAWTLINSEMSKESKSIAGAGAHSDRYNNLSTGEREVSPSPPSSFFCKKY
jgi:outer membrane biosynthesis protein TonB